MKKRDNNSTPSENPTQNKDGNLPGYPVSPNSEDAYSKWKEEEEIDPEDTTKLKVADDLQTVLNEKDFDDDVTGGDLDIPGSELDDEQEKIGSEDEENNYYSLGGDNHEDLEEDRG